MQSFFSKTKSNETEETVKQLRYVSQNKVQGQNHITLKLTEFVVIFYGSSSLDPISPTSRNIGIRNKPYNFITSSLFTLFANHCTVSRSSLAVLPGNYCIWPVPMDFVP